MNDFYQNVWSRMITITTTDQNQCPINVVLPQLICPNKIFIPWKDNFLLLMLSMNCWPILVVYHLSCCWHQRCVVVYWHKRDWLISLLSLPPLIICGRLMLGAFRHWDRFYICCLLIVWDWPHHWSTLKIHDVGEEVNVMFLCRPCMKKINYFFKLLLLVIIAINIIELLVEFN